MLYGINGEPIGDGAENSLTPGEAAYKVQAQEVVKTLKRMGGQYLLIFNHQEHNLSGAVTSVGKRNTPDLVNLFANGLVQNPNFRSELLMAIDASLTSSLGQRDAYEKMQAEEEALQAKAEEETEAWENKEEGEDDAATSDTEG